MTRIPTRSPTRFATRIAAGAALTLASLGLFACGDDSTGAGPAEPRTVTFSLTTPNADDGAILVRLRGASVTGVTPVGASYRVFARQSSPTESSVIVLGDLAGGPVFTARVAGGPVTATVEEVATRGDALRAGVQGYGITQ